MRRRTIAALALLWCACGGQTPKLEDAVARSKKDSRVLVAYFTADWCGPCKRFKAEVLPSAQVRKALAQVDFVVYRDESTRGRHTRRRLGISSFPTFVAFDANGKVIGVMHGATKELFLDFIEYAQVKGLSEDMLKARLADGGDAEELTVAGRWYALHERVDEALSALEQAAKKADSDEQRERPLFYRMLLQSRGGDVEALAVRAASHFETFPKGRFRERALRLAVVAESLPAERVEALAKLAVRTADGDGQWLNRVVYLLLAARQCHAAMGAAQRQLVTNPGEANPYDTLAEVHHCLGARSEALRLADLAIDKAEDGRSRLDYEQNRARFAGAEGVESPDARSEREQFLQEIAALGIVRRSRALGD